jgi:hypothetical protein
MDHSVAVDEVSEAGSKTDLFAEHKGDIRVIFLEGDERLYGTILPNTLAMQIVSGRQRHTSMVTPLETDDAVTIASESPVSDMGNYYLPVGLPGRFSVSRWPWV